MIILLTEGQPIAVDSQTGNVIKSKSGETEAQFLKRMRAWQAVQAQKRRRERKAD